MTYRWFTDLPDALAGFGIPFVLVDGWATRGRPPSVGEHKPTGVLNHHTASPLSATDAAEMAVILKGNSEAPGPIYHLFTGRNLVTHVVAAGRCNHGGAAVIPHIGSAVTNANTHLLSHSASNNGVGEYWRDDLVGRMVDVNAALCQAYGWPVENSYHHWFTGQPAGNYKIDCAGPYAVGAFARGQSWDIPAWRRLVASRLTRRPTAAAGIPVSEDKMQVRFRHSDFANVFVLPEGTPESGGIDAAFQAMPLVQEAHAQTLAACCYRSWGITGVNPGDIIARAVAAGFLVPLGPH